MDESNSLTEGTAATLDEQLLPAVDILGVENETDVEKVNGLSFEVYKEAVSVVNLAISPCFWPPIPWCAATAPGCPGMHRTTIEAPSGGAARDGAIA